MDENLKKGDILYNSETSDLLYVTETPKDNVKFKSFIIGDKYKVVESKLFESKLYRLGNSSDIDMDIDDFIDMEISNCNENIINKGSIKDQLMRDIKIKFLTSY